MASLQKIALFLFFDSIESDLIELLRGLPIQNDADILKDEEKLKAKRNLASREFSYNLDDGFDLMHGLDLGEKYDVVLRHKNLLDQTTKEHLLNNKRMFGQCIQVRNSVMHGRPLTIDEYAKGFALAQELLNFPKAWPRLCNTFKEYKNDPQSLVKNSIKLVEEFQSNEILNNLPVPEHDETGFFPRPKLEKELKKKILGRHPVVTVLGDGGNGKTAVTLQTLYGLLGSNDHDYDAIIWTSAKSSKLSKSEIQRIEDAITDSMSLFGEVAGVFEASSDDPVERVRELLSENKILLVIDNLETVIDSTIRDFAADVPGESKLLLTSRIPLGSDLSVQVDAFSENEALAFLRILIATFGISTLRKSSDDDLARYATRLGNKPLLLKWFALGVLSGTNPETIVRNPEIALKFCLENVFENLSPRARSVIAVLSQLPRAVSLPILEYVTEDEAKAIEAGLAELMRFGLVEQTSTKAFETEYQLKALARAYLIRVMKLSSKNSSTILSRYRGIDAIYQRERGAEAHDRFNPRNYTVRSKSEALAVRKLRQAKSLSAQNDYEGAFDVIDELKVSIPDYFEVSRTEAFIAYHAGDYSRALDAYEAACELDSMQPQLYQLYGGFLLRAFNDFEGAMTQFEKGLEIEPKALPILVEAARARMYLLEFDQAQKLIDTADLDEAPDLRIQTIFSDLQLQIFCRRMEYLIESGSPRDAIPFIGKLSIFLSTIGVEHLDALLVEHIEKYRSITTRLRSSLEEDHYQIIDYLEKQFSTTLELVVGGQDKEVNKIEVGDHGGKRIGMLKQNGKKPTFGFLIDQDKIETFVPKATLSPAIWTALWQGETVEYDIERKDDGRTQAVNVKLFSKQN